MGSNERSKGKGAQLLLARLNLRRFSRFAIMLFVAGLALGGVGPTHAQEFRPETVLEPRVIPGMVEPFAADPMPGPLGIAPGHMLEPDARARLAREIAQERFGSQREPPSVDPEVTMPRSELWTWQLLPEGIIYTSYLAAPKESRFASIWNYDDRWGATWDMTAGGRVGLIRYGSEGAAHPEGWELDLEGAAFPRLDLDDDEDLISADFRVGVPLTFGSGPFQVKLEAYHLSSHLGDEYQLRFPEYPRINYSRNALVLGGSYYPTEAVRVYAEAEWAFYIDGGAKPWQFQFGLDYSPKTSRACGAPFVALNTQIREEIDYDGSFVTQVGWQWRGQSNRLFRAGAQYFLGKSDQFQFYQRHEERIGLGIWYDF